MAKKKEIKPVALVATTHEKEEAKDVAKRRSDHYKKQGIETAFSYDEDSGLLSCFQAKDKVPGSKPVEKLFETPAKLQK